MSNNVGVEVELVQAILNQLDQEITDLSDLITEVGVVGESIEQYWSGNAANTFRGTMSDFVEKTNQTIPVLESIRNWVMSTAMAYADREEDIISMFNSYN